MRTHSAVANLRQENKTLAHAIWGNLDPVLDQALEQLTNTHSFCIASGDIILLNGRWYVTHSGLISLAVRERCSGISASVVRK